MDSKRKSPTSILIVDKHPIFLLGLSALIDSLGPDFQIVGRATDGGEAQELAATLHPDLILMSLRLPTASGLECTRILKAKFPEFKIVIISAFNDMAEISQILREGASGYLLKTIGEEELRVAIEGAVKGQAVFSPEVAKKLLADLRQPGKDMDSLSERESQILQHVAMGWTNKQIGNEYFLSVRTVETHVHNIFQKLGVTTRTEAVTVALRRHLIQVA